jgi:hypothetical protein
MKNRLVILSMLTLALTSYQCTKSKSNSNCYKGKLVKKALCMNYTISLLEGDMDTSLYEASWTDPNTGTTYTNAFRLGSPCNFPSNLQEGDEFYFKIGPQANDCAVCMAYYPTPTKAVEIEVLSGSCEPKGVN